MKYRVLAAAVMVWVAAFLQSTLLEYMELFSVRPNLLLVLTVTIALLRSPGESALMGLLFGLTMDMLMGKTIGWYGLLFMLAAIPIAMVNEKLYKERPLVMMTFSMCATLAVETFFILIVFMFSGYRYVPYLFTTVILPEAVYNGFLILPFFITFRNLYNNLDNIDRKRNRLLS